MRQLTTEFKTKELECELAAVKTNLFCFINLSLYNAMAIYKLAHQTGKDDSDHDTPV
jgi:hypothetical protein